MFMIYCYVWLSILWICSAGVYPNYHGVFEFTTYDNRLNSMQYKESEQKWWQTGTFYQIYPRSFKDSSGNGVGDLKGILEKLDYLKEIGITAAWISPIFKSPMADFGYDISNFTEIDPLFGNLDDLQQLISKAKQLNIRILLDFVPNHSSDECLWFRKSAENDPYYKDFYIWHPGKIVNGSRQPPNNWLSVFRGSAWTWHEKRQEYYFHQFLDKQPDLNYRNDKVKAAMKNVLVYWLEKGISGFRIDAVPHIFEVAMDANGELPNEPVNNDVTDPDDYAHLNHIYTVDQPETIDLLYEWRKVLDDYVREHGVEECILMAESYSPLSVVMKYYGNSTTEGIQIPFNFQLITHLNNDSNANDYANTINNWLNTMPSGRIANWLLGNHDKNRIGTRLGIDRIDMMNIMLYTLPGCSITYNGEEIGMTDVWISWQDTVDPSACNSNPKIYERFSRDPERTPFQWTNEYQAGFTKANKTWLPLANNYQIVNVQTERSTSLSHLNIFKNLQELRATATLRFGTTVVKALNNQILAIKRTLLHNYTYLVLINLFDNTESIDLRNVLDEMPDEMIYVLVTDKSLAKKNDRVESSKIKLQPKEAVILRSSTKLTTTMGYFTYYLPEDKVKYAYMLN